MATRTISTKLAIEGESEYRAAITRVNGELKLLQSELDLTQNVFKENANSIDALTEKHNLLMQVQEKQNAKVEKIKDALNNAETAVRDYSAEQERLYEALDKCAEEMDILSASGDGTSDAQKRLSETAAGYQKELSENTKKLEAAQKGADAWKISLNKAQAELNDVNRAVNENDTYLKEAENSTNQCASSIDNLGNKVKGAGENAGKAEKQIEKIGDTAKETGDAAQEMGEKSSAAVDSLVATMAASGLKDSFEKLRDAIRACIDASVEFESAMAGVAKTTELTPEELDAMGESLKELSTRIPQSASELAGLTEAAGQLGIQKDALLSFTEVMANLGVATNLSADQAATSLAKFANVVGMNAENYDRLGSTIVALGNNFATTESDIVDMATRISSTGAIIDLTEPQIMAIAASLSSVGIEAEAGGSAISKLLKEMEVSAKTYSAANDAVGATGKSLRELEMLANQDGKAFKEMCGELGMTTDEMKNFMAQKETLEQFAEVAGMTAEEFIDAWGTNAVGALDSFIGGLNDTERTGKSAVEILDEMGLTEVRLSNAVLSLASNGQILTDSVNLANTAWEDNTALAKEAETRYETTESKMQLLSNAFENVKASIGDDLTPAIREFSDAGIDALTWAGDFIERNEWLVPVIGGVAGAMGALTIAVGGYMAITKLLVPVMTAFNTALLANPAAAVAVAIGTLVTAVAGFAMLSRDDAVPSVKELTDSVTDMKRAFESADEVYSETAESVEATAALAQEYIDRLEELERQGLKTEESQAEYRDTIEKLRAIMPELNITLNEQTGLIEGGTKALREQADAWKKVAIEEALQTKYKEQTEAWAKAKVELYENQQKLNRATDEGAAIQRRMKEASEEYERVCRRIQEIGDIGWEGGMTDELESEMERLQERASELDDELLSLSEAYGTNEKMQRTLQEAVNVGTEALGEYEEKLDSARAILEDYERESENTAKTEERKAESIRKATDAVSESTGKLDEYGNVAQATEFKLERLSEVIDKNRESAELAARVQQAVQEEQENTARRIEALIDSYDKAYNAAAESLNGQINIWGDASDKTKVSIEEMIANIQEQQKANEAYYDNLQKVSKAAADGQIEISAGLRAAIADTGEEGRLLAQKLADALKEGNYELVQSLSDAYEEYAQSAQRITERNAAFAVDFDNTMRAIQSTILEIKQSLMGIPAEMHDIGYQSGSNFAAGYQAGISSGASQVTYSASQLGSNAVNALRVAQMEKSPSRLTRQSGANFTLGYAGGILDEMDRASAAAKMLAEKTALELPGSAEFSLDTSIPGTFYTMPGATDGNATGTIYLTVTVPEMTVRDEADIENVAQALYTKARASLRAKGVKIF